MLSSSSAFSFSLSFSIVCYTRYAILPFLTIYITVPTPSSSFSSAPLRAAFFHPFHSTFNLFTCSAKFTAQTHTHTLKHSYKLFTHSIINILLSNQEKCFGNYFPHNFINLMLISEINKNRNRKAKKEEKSGIRRKGGKRKSKANVE